MDCVSWASSAHPASVETGRAFIDNAFLLEQLFRQLMTQANCRAMTINGCMGTIMPMAETSACLS
ncbi:MAG: hypothetical protein FJ276_29485, partial [Planctomycetes bacterium]|nr:hypothetical protein [Planctomycetota bacterium]